MGPPVDPVAVKDVGRRLNVTPLMGGRPVEGEEQKKVPQLPMDVPKHLTKPPKPHVNRRLLKSSVEATVSGASCDTKLQPTLIQPKGRLAMRRSTLVPTILEARLHQAPYFSHPLLEDAGSAAKRSEIFQTESYRGAARNDSRSRMEDAEGRYR